MALVIYSQSESFKNHINKVIKGEVCHCARLLPAFVEPEQISLVHASSYIEELPVWLEAVGDKSIIGIASNHPQVKDLLSYTELGVQGYFNAYMSAPHYEQLLRLLANGQSWYPPALLSEVFQLARSTIKLPSTDNPLEVLTKRERDVALAVAEGKSNKLVASSCNMAERTVKAHLTHIYKKLKVKNRVALVIYLSQFDFKKYYESLNQSNG